MALDFKRALKEKSNLPGRNREPLEVMLGVPANANSNQRFLTVEPFQRAGFEVLGLLNEPSAASVEYGHRNRSAENHELVLVYDLGGGTFDASLVRIEGEFIPSSPVRVCPMWAAMTSTSYCRKWRSESEGLDADALTQAEVFRLHKECRARKEALHPNTRRIVVDLGVIREQWTGSDDLGDRLLRMLPAADPTHGRGYGKAGCHARTPRRLTRYRRWKRTANGGEDAEGGLRPARATVGVHPVGDSDRARHSGRRVRRLFAS